MGSRGPVPKRSEERRRRNKESTPDTVERQGEVLVPEPNGQWHEIAHTWYVSLAESGQSDFYEPSDWAEAYLTAEAMTRLFSGARFSSELFKAVLAAGDRLMTTESSRRRLRVEVSRLGAGSESAEPAEVTALDDYRARLGG